MAFYKYSPWISLATPENYHYLYGSVLSSTRHSRSNDISFIHRPEKCIFQQENTSLSQEHREYRARLSVQLAPRIRYDIVAMETSAT